MGKTLVIAEKYKAAKALVAGLNEPFSFVEKKGWKGKSAPTGYFESNDKIVTYTSGHLFGLYDVEDYTGSKDKSWKLDILPYIPKTFKLKITKDETNFASIQFEIIKSLISRQDVDLVVHFGDPDNEGELLIREILDGARNTKPVKRMICQSLVPNIVAQAFYSLKEERYFNGMYKEALARQQTDWLLGINLTRFVSIKAGSTFQVGRVLIPIVKYIYDRDMQIKNFKKKSSFGIDVDITKETFKKTIFQSEPKIYFDSTDKDECQLLCDNLNKQGMIVENISVERKKIKPQKLMNLTDFRSEMSKKYGYSLDESTQAAQRLYEDGFITYPRTDSQYLSEAEKDSVKQTINLIKNIYGINLTFKDTKAVFDDTKTSSEGHTALTLTTKFPSDKDLDKFSNNVRDGYSVIFGRFISNFYPQPLIERTTVTLKSGEYSFNLYGDSVVEKGFLDFEKTPLRPTLPTFTKGEKVDAVFKLVERETTPPKKVTLTQLLDYLHNPYAEELRKANPNDDTEYYKLLKEGVSLGTQATVNSIINNAVKYSYISFSKKTFSILPKGINLIEILNQLGINLYKERNIQMNKDLRKIGNETLTVEENKENIKNELTSIIYGGQSINVSVQNPDNEVFGKCPLCGKDVTRNKRFEMYHCSDRNCPFKIYDKDVFFKSFGKKVNKKIITELLDKKYVIFRNLISKKNNKPYSIKITLEGFEKYPKYSTEFVNDSKEKGG